MAKRIITISREFGSGGRFIGEEVAKKLGIAYYDKDIIGQIAEQSGLSPEYIKENAELSPKKGLFAYAFVLKKMQSYPQRKAYLHMHLPDVTLQESP
ncbi:cytidylate kinase [Dorea sp. CAG:105]|nr:cytidylate kinase [Dorea sp. CAG:105]